MNVNIQMNDDNVVVTSPDHPKVVITLQENQTARIELEAQATYIILLSKPRGLYTLVELTKAYAFSVAGTLISL